MSSDLIMGKTLPLLPGIEPASIVCETNTLCTTPPSRAKVVTQVLMQGALFLGGLTFPSVITIVAQLPCTRC